MNAKKTKSLILGSTYKLEGLQNPDMFKLDGIELKFTDVYNYLGIQLDKNMTLTPLIMITKVRAVVTNTIYSLVKIRNCITTQCALAIYKQTILPLLDYSVFVLISANISDRRDLQTLQNHALRICYNVRLRDHVSVKNMHVRA